MAPLAFWSFGSPRHSSLPLNTKIHPPSVFLRKPPKAPTVRADGREEVGQFAPLLTPPPPGYDIYCRASTRNIIRVAQRGRLKRAQIFAPPSKCRPRPTCASNAKMTWWESLYCLWESLYCLFSPSLDLKPLTGDKTGVEKPLDKD